MPDRMDDVLARMPSESCPSDLVLRVQGRLAIERRRALWLRRATVAASSLASAVGIWLLAPRAGLLSSAVPQVTTAGLGEWVGAALETPVVAWETLLARGIAWFSAATGCLQTGLIAALALIALPALYGAVRLLGDRPRPGGVIG
jgi:hypothetical protein